MTWELDGQGEAVEEALAGGVPQRVGWFRFFFEDQRWEWSDEVGRIHGYEPGSVTPTTELVLAHKHPEDRERVVASIDDMVNRRQAAFSTRHRIVDTGGAVHDVVVVGDQIRDEDGDVIGTRGFCIDVAPASAEDAITRKVAKIAERRSVIEQAKGMLMLIYGIDDEAAFNVLKSLSQVHNMKLGLLAQQIATDFCALSGTLIGSRSRFDQDLLTAHLRAAESAGHLDGATP
ncbi:PAS and ANTAR domain-containing protein [Mycobacterium sp. HUMS_1102779]|uniref:PAS and ANTAR domain-containing protein n=1 Tax=Mycobacterium sp. HUMS_1102779 TaxID=3383487 RepID=UPI00389A0E24